VVADEYPNFSICGIQFLVPGDVRDWRMLAHRSMADLEAAGVRLLLNTTANDVEVDARRLSVADGGRARVGLPDDELAIATGATPESPPIGGVDAPGQDDGVFLLHTMIYSWRYPESIHRSVMIGVNPPRALRVGSGNDGRTDPALRSPLLQRRQLPRPDRRPSAPADDLMRRTCGPHLQRQ
jgi:hypothetical protein